ncbi:Protein of unknown function [Pyronema omphalodes CBS 100304]|uniref:Uncharacterized protein n=1 Tax=Pyronema omphalodes (strain CBS 100304) TaxID=1076935 RepID=U4KZD5_PYROM|nr:Protein of unknown function [Pyronema omphalodes CBS 100304]
MNDDIIKHVGTGHGKMSKLHALARETSGGGEWVIGRAVMNVAVLHRRTEELKRCTSRRGRKGVDYCMLADIGAVVNWAVAHDNAQPLPELPTAEELRGLGLKVIGGFFLENLKRVRSGKWPCSCRPNI